MKKIIITAYILLLSFISFAQPTTPNIARQHAAYMDSFLPTVGIDRQLIKTGILYDRAMSLTNLQSFDQTKNISKGLFFQAALELRNAAYDTLHYPSPENLRHIVDFYTYIKNHVPIGLMYSEFTYIDTLSVEKEYIFIDGEGRVHPTDRLKKEGLNDKEVLLSTILSDEKEIETQVSFILPDELMFGNRLLSISQVEIDFDDGQGFRVINPGTPMDISYSSGGKKTVIVRVSTDEGESLSSISTLNVKETYHKTGFSWGRYGTIPSDHRRVPIYADISFTGEPPYSSLSGTFPGLGWVTYLMQDSSEGLKNPVLIVDGFDPGNKRKDEDLFENYINADYKFADELYDAGYDLVILDFPKAVLRGWC